MTPKAPRAIFARMSAQLEQGAVFAGRYRVVRRLASGGMGSVYEVVHVETNRRRALKVMHPHLFQNEEMHGRFKLEARIAAEVDSEYIVEVFDAGVDEATRTPFLVMELLRGEELGDRLTRLGPLPLEEVVTYMEQTAWALDRTHAASIVHRDLKPQNLFLTTREDGTPRIKILDFGVAKLVAEGVTAAGVTRSLGTPLYMAPEQFRGSLDLSAATDIHALTQMTYTLLVGTAYWREESKSMGDVIAFAMQVVKGLPEPAVRRAARSGVALPPGFDAWFAQGTAVNPADRFPTASEAIRALRAAVDPASAGVAPPAPLRAMASSPALSAPTSRSGLAAGSMVERAAMSTGGASMTASPADSGRALLVTGAVALGGVLVVGAWMMFGQEKAAPAAPVPIVVAAISAAPPARSAVPVEVTPAPSVVVVAAPSATVLAAPAPPAATAAKPTPKPVAPKRPIAVDPGDFTRR